MTELDKIIENTISKDIEQNSLRISVELRRKFSEKCSIIEEALKDIRLICDIGSVGFYSAVSNKDFDKEMGKVQKERIN